MEKNEIKGLLLKDFLKNFNHTMESVREEILELLKTTKAITVHDGKDFHQDETLAIALLLVVAEKILGISANEITIIRTRNPEAYKGVIVDVGMGYCDHHMEPERCAYREDGIKYAAAGLCWAYLGSLLVAESEVKHIDRKLFKPSDMGDNGQGSRSITFASLMSPFEDEEDDLMEFFMQTVEHYKLCIERLVKSSIKKMEKDDVTPYVKEGEKTGIMELPKGMPWLEDAVESGVKFVVWPNEDETSEDKWKAQVVPVNYDTFEAKVDFPATYNGHEILGKRADFFCNIEGISGLNFVHPARFFVCSKDKESIMKLIKTVL